jgi:hypothetical protein
MRMRAIQPGDIVFCNKGGRLFHAKVIGTGAAGRQRSTSASDAARTVAAVRVIVAR